MDIPFDVFKVEPDGVERWIAEAKTLNMAEFEAELAALKSPGKYILLDRSSGKRVELNIG